MKDQEFYGITDAKVGETPSPTDEMVVRRRIGSAMASLMDTMVRRDAPMDELEAMAGQLEALDQQMKAHSRKSQSKIYMRWAEGKATRQDVLDILDYDVFTGQSTAICPPLKLWLDGDVVRGSANLGLVYQGPPGRVHGGIIAGMLDMLLAKCQDITGTMGVTGTLKIKYLAATPIKKDIQMEARIVREEGKKLFVEGKFFVDGVQTVHAEGIWFSVFVQAPKDL